MFRLHNVPSAHSFPFVKQDRSTCRRYMRIVHWRNGEQVSRTVLTLCFQLVSRGPPGSWHAAVSAWAILAYLQVAPYNHEDWEKVQPRSVTEGCSACRRMEEETRVLSLARSIGAYREAPCVKMCKNLEIISDKKKRVRSRMRTYTTYGQSYIYIEKSARCDD